MIIQRGILCVFIAVAVTMSGFSDEIKVTGNAPTFKTSDPDAQQFIGQFNEKLGEAFDGKLGEIQDMINENVPAGFVNSNGLLNGFGTSSVFSSHGATMRAYAEYKFLSISVGSILGLKLPDNSTKTLMDGLSGGDVDFESLLSNDLKFGINPQFFNIHVGMRPSALLPIIPKDLFLGLRLGFFGLKDLEIPLSNTPANLNFNTFTIGVTANYQLIPTLNLLGLIKWRGVNVGSGILFQTTKLDFTIPFDDVIAPIGENVTIGGGLDNLNLVLDPRALLNMNINTVTIPVEVFTAINLIFVNIPIGFGFDIGFGKSELSVGAEAGVNIQGGNSNLVTQDKSGSLSAGIKNNDVAPSAFNFKIMTGLGFSFGDVFVIDIPITFYIKDGFNLGFTLGLRF